MIKLIDIESEKFYYNNLFRDYIFNFERVKDNYAYDYRKIDTYKKRYEDVINEYYNNSLRLDVADILLEYNKKLKCSQRTIKNIQSLKEKGSLVIIGGQQPGFLTGSAFIIYKILTILKASIFFQELLKIKVVPCFWNAADDSNFGQVDNLNILEKELKSITLDLSNIKDIKPGTRLANIFIPCEYIKEKLIEVLSLLKPTEYSDKIRVFLLDCLEISSKSFSNASGMLNFPSFFSVLISQMFSEYGLVVIDPSDIRLKKFALDLINYDLDNFSSINGLINDEGEKLISEGYHAQINFDKSSPNFFMDDVSGVRQKITKEERNLFQFSEKLWARNDLANMIEKHASDLSLNVVLRPIFQDTILPVLCTVCGPGEVSYFAQLNKVYKYLNKKMPVIYPRFSATVIENKIKKTLGNFNIDVNDLEFDKDKLLKKIINKNLDNNLDKTLANFEQDLILKLKNLEDFISDNGMETGSSFDRIKRNLASEVVILKKKLYSEYKKKNNYILENLDKIYLNIFPNNNLQERELNIFNYINKYDFSFIDKLYNGVGIMDFKHKLISIF
jgi:bacillithiol biosynthesis cysteine-adding enzyme BshC